VGYPRWFSIALGGLFRRRSSASTCTSFCDYATLRTDSALYALPTVHPSSAYIRLRVHFAFTWHLHALHPRTSSAYVRLRATLCVPPASAQRLPTCAYEYILPLRGTSMRYIRERPAPMCVYELPCAFHPHLPSAYMRLRIHFAFTWHLHALHPRTSSAYVHLRVTLCVTPASAQRLHAPTNYYLRLRGTCSDSYIC
ncbi:hypothetical protein R3P38DRAFT_3454761, partial [Favolaschia claudopus]